VYQIATSYKTKIVGAMVKGEEVNFFSPKTHSWPASNNTKTPPFSKILKTSNGHKSHKLKYHFD